MRDNNGRKSSGDGAPVTRVSSYPRQQQTVAFFAAALLLCLWLMTTLVAADPKPPVLTGRVVDLAGMLDAGEEQAIHRKLAELEEKTTDQLVVITLADLQGYTIEEFGVALGRGWKIGQEGKNNGVLLIVAPNDRKVRIEVGYGLEGVLTDTLAGNIVHNRILPLFRSGRMAEGIRTGVDDIIATLTGDAAEVAERAKGKRRSDEQFDPMFLFILGIWAVMFFGGISQSLTSGRGRRGGVIVIPYVPPASGSWSTGTGSSSGSWGGGGGGFSGGGGSFGGGGSSGSW